MRSQNPSCPEFRPQRRRRPKVRLPVAMLFSLVVPAAVSHASESAGDLTPAQELGRELREVGMKRFTSPDYKPGTIRHIVLFRYRPGTSKAVQAEVKRRFLDLKRLSPYIVSVETGAQNSGEGADQGLQQGFLLTFRSEGERNFYVGAPIITDPSAYDLNHQAFKEFVGPLLDKNGALVFDYRVE